MNFIKHPQLSKDLWLAIRAWQKAVGMTDEVLAACLKVNVRTLKSYDISAHGLTLEKTRQPRLNLWRGTVSLCI